MTWRLRAPELQGPQSATFQINQLCVAALTVIRSRKKSCLFWPLVETAAHLGTEFALKQIQTGLIEVRNLFELPDPQRVQRLCSRLSDPLDACQIVGIVGITGKLDTGRFWRMIFCRRSGRGAH